MRQLEVVAISDDGSYVLLAGDENATRATHAVRIDNRLQAAIRGDLDDSDERRESELSPRDIQARLRAGETTEAVAKAAKVPVARVMRYAGPVLSERERVVEQAQAAVLQRARGPELTTPLGEVVDKRLAATAGLRPDTVVWDARRRDDGAWVVVLNYSARGGARTASWLWDPAERELASLNNLATRLGAQESPARKRPARKAAARKAPARKRPARKVPARKGPARKPRAKKSPAKKAPAKGARAKKAAAKRVPARRTVAKRVPATKRAVPARPPAVKRPAAKSAVATKPATKRPSRAAAKRPAKPAAPQPAHHPAPAAEPAVIEPTVRRKNGRVEIPSWSDVLIGVQAPASSRGRPRS